MPTSPARTPSIRSAPERRAGALLAAALAFPLSAAAASPLDWLADKLHWHSDGGASAPAPARESLRDRGPVMLKPGEPVRVRVDEQAPEAELPRGRSRFRRIEVEGSVKRAHVRVAVVAQDIEGARGRSVFKPLLYLLDEEGNVRSTVEYDVLELDMRPFKPTRLTGCAEAQDVQRFLVATAEKSIGTAYESAARDAVKAPTQNGFYYSSTEGQKVRLPYAATGELVLDVVPAEADARPCPARKTEAKDAKPAGKDAPATS